MRKIDKCLWVVYRMNINGKPIEANAVCEQAAWDAMERTQPGHRILVQAGIASEGEAERLARISSIGAKPNEACKSNLFGAARATDVDEAAIAGTDGLAYPSIASTSTEQ